MGSVEHLVVVERDEPIKALSISLRALRVAMWFAVNMSGFNNARPDESS